MRKLSLLLMIVICGTSLVLADDVKKESMVSQAKRRSFYLYVPENLDRSVPAPLLVMLHGSGSSGHVMASRWVELAKKEGIIVVGPNALDSEAWKIPEDAPDFIYEMVESLKRRHNIDPKRVYLFGHSGGGIVGLYLALMQSEYFAAAAIHAGTIYPKDAEVIDRARRKIPISLYIGTKDSLFSVAEMREMRNMLGKRGFYAELHEIANHNHDYAKRAPQINPMVWSFLRNHQLKTDPVHQMYRWDNAVRVIPKDASWMSTMR